MKLKVFVVTAWEIGSPVERNPEVFFDQPSAEARALQIVAQPRMRAHVRPGWATGTLSLFVLSDPKSIPEVYTTRELAEAQRHAMTYPSINEVEVDKEYPNEP